MAYKAARRFVLVAMALCAGGLVYAQFFPFGAALSWDSFAKGPQHGALALAAAQPLTRIHWQTPVDLQPQYSGGELLIHYGSPLITAAGTVIVSVKTGAAGGFRVDARNASDGSLKWSQASDYALPPHDWIPVFGAAITGRSRVYFPGPGGTVYFRNDPDNNQGLLGRFAFYGLSQYMSNAAAYNATVIINTPITSDPMGDIFFGFEVTGANPSNLSSGIARISQNGEANWIPVTVAANDSTMTKVVHNCAPALSQDLQTLYVTVSNGTAGYLVSVDSRTLRAAAHVRLKDPASGQDAWLNDDGSATPTIGPDGDVYYGVLGAPAGQNHYRGWLLHFDSTLAQSKTPGSFGWDDTASIVPAFMVPTYTGKSSYLVMTKYNDYLESGGNGLNKIAVLDPNAVEVNPPTGIAVMREVLTVAGLTPDGPAPAVKEWCINSAAVDPATRSIMAGSEDGKLYRWNLVTNQLDQLIILSGGLGEAYTPTAIGSDGQVYAINNATLFAVGR
jgi:hypothetical protein